MTEPASAPSGESHEPRPPAAGNPSPKVEHRSASGRAAEGSVLPPRALRIASVLWICNGVFLVFGVLGQNAQPVDSSGSIGDELHDNLFTTLIRLLAPVLIAVGVAIVVLAPRMKRGSESARRWLTWLGASSLIIFWPVLFFVPALVLQGKPESKAWFHAVNGRDPGASPP